MNKFQELDVLEDIVIFLQEFSWLHNFPVIRIFSLNVLERLPDEWKKWFDEENNSHLDLLASSLLCKDISYSSLKSFIKGCEEYSLSSLFKSRLKSLSFEVVEETLTSLQKEKGNSNSSSSSIQNQISDAEINCSVGKIYLENPWKRIRQANEKKKHEVEELSSFVKKMKHFTKTDQIFDIGSGLGYLGLYLHLVHGYKVIGAEGSLSNVKASLKLQNNCLRTTCPAVKFIHWNLDDDGKTIEQAKLVTKNDLLSCTCSCGYDLNSVMDVKNSPTLSYDIVSLHSCADLSPIMLKIFSNNENLSSLVSLSCCYHKMVPCVEEEEEPLATMKTNSKFKNFPLSRNLYDILEKREFKMNTFSLRLAAEESLCQYHNRTKTRNKLTEDVISIAYRAILQTVCELNGLQMKKRRRHCGKKSSYATFEEYISIIFEDYLFLTSSNDPFSNFNYLTSQLLQFYLKVKESLKYIALIRTLQLNLQPVLEGLILLDRVLYLKENGFSYSGIFELFDDAISPRNKAIFAFREKFLNL